MTRKEIKQGNRLIAEFMGAKIALKDGRYKTYGWENQDEPHSSTPVTWCKTPEATLKHLNENQDFVWVEFRNSWDWIKPVIDKIKSLEKDYPLASDGVINSFIWESIDVVWKRIVDFIKLYNSDAEPTRTTPG